MKSKHPSTYSFYCLFATRQSFQWAGLSTSFQFLTIVQVSARKVLSNADSLSYQYYRTRAVYGNFSVSIRYATSVYWESCIFSSKVWWYLERAEKTQKNTAIRTKRIKAWLVDVNDVKRLVFFKKKQFSSSKPETS